MSDSALEGAEESFDPTVLPGAMAICSLVPNAEQPEAEAEQSRGENGFIVRADDARFAERLDGIQQAAQQGEGGFIRNTRG